MEVPDALVRFAQALADDADLRLWFDSLAEHPHRVRAAEFRAIAARMKNQGYPEDLAHATSLLAAPGLYEAVQEAVEGLT